MGTSYQSRAAYFSQSYLYSFSVFSGTAAKKLSGRRDYASVDLERLRFDFSDFMLG